MQMIPNWQRVALRAWSMWFGVYLPLVWLAVPEALWAWYGVQISPVLTWVVAVVLATMAGALRLVDQGIQERRP